MRHRPYFAENSLPISWRKMPRLLPATAIAMTRAEAEAYTLSLKWHFEKDT